MEGHPVDVSNPISSVIPSLDGPVLGALSGTSMPMSLTEVHRLVGVGSLSGVRRVLVRLVATGVVKSVPGGYVLNRDHVAAAAIEMLARLWATCLERIRTTVGQWPEKPRLVGVFGSAARRDGDEDSDIDLLVVSDTVGAENYSADLAEAVGRWTGNPAHVVTVTMTDIGRMRRARERVLAEWDRDLIAVVGDRKLLQEAG